MDLGLGNLFTLKGWLLAASLQSSTDYDAQIVLLGRGVAASMEAFCNRKFGRVVGDIFECSADRTHLILPRYPVEVVTLLEQRDSLPDGFVALDPNDYVWNQSLSGGLIYFNAQLGIYLSRLRVTFTGGFFYETLEPTDGGYPTALPAGAAPLPADLLQAWLMQCEHEWSQHDKLGKTVAEDPKSNSPLLETRLIPQVERVLRNYIRYAIS